MFHVGQKVVCVDDMPREPWKTCSVKKGVVYTVSCVRFDRKFGEIVDITEVPANSALLYYADRFRPIVEKKTDTGMAILKEILERESFDERIRQPAR